jgi:hypothetical protein
MFDPDMITKSRLLRERGWTEWAIVNLLGDPDEEQPNPMHRGGFPMHLYRRERVQAVEQSEAFQQWQQERAARKRPAARARGPAPAADAARQSAAPPPAAAGRAAGGSGESAAPGRPGRPRLYASDADRQAAYRERQRQERAAQAEREQQILQEAESLRRTIASLLHRSRRSVPALEALAELDTPDLLAAIGRHYAQILHFRELPVPSGLGKRARKRAAKEEEPGAPESYTDALRRQYRSRMAPPPHDPR